MHLREGAGTAQRAANASGLVPPYRTASGSSPARVALADCEAIFRVREDNKRVNGENIDQEGGRSLAPGLNPFVCC